MNFPNGSIKVLEEYGDKKILAAGPLNKQENTMPYRTVLVATHDGQLVVWREQYNHEIDARSYSGGYYFKMNEFSRAYSKFCERLTSQTENIESLERFPLNIV